MDGSPPRVSALNVIVLFFLGILVVKAFEDDEIKIDEKRGLQLPPPKTGYFYQFNRCGDVNNGNAHNIGKRSIKTKNQPPSELHGDDYILNGDDVEDFFYPWVGKLQYNTDTYDDFSGIGHKFDWRHKCTLSLISSRHALTALHCFYDQHKAGYGKTFTDIKANDLRVVFGNDDGYRISKVDKIKELQLENVIIRNILKLHVPPKFDNRMHDLAMLEFNDVTLTDKFRPICLPIHGMPVDIGNYILAGYGYTGMNPDTLEPFYGDKLQEMKDLYFQEIDLRPSKVITLANSNLVYDAYDPVSKKPVNHFILYNGHHQKTSPCLGDSGGPLMWKYPSNNKFYIMGVNTNTRRTVVDIYKCNFTAKEQLSGVQGNKVTYFLPWIVEKMKPPAAQLVHCLHDDCKLSFPANVPVTRTWMLDAVVDQEMRLVPPCAKYKGINNICAVNIKADRRKLLKPMTGDAVPNEELVAHKFRFCHPCNDLDWDDSNYLDEITAGSFSQKPMLGQTHFAEAPDKTTLPQPDRDVQLPYTSLCDVFAEDSNHVYCPSNSSVTTDTTCILSEHICDGFDDCPDGWDESPHHCIGKCDLFQQYQYPHFISNYVKDNYQEVPLDTPKKCHDWCMQDNMCTHFVWFGKENNERYDEAGVCVPMQRYNLPDGNEDQAAETATLDAEYVIRGPKECPGMFKEHNDQLMCQPTNGIPFRTGFFLIQSYNGLYLEYSEDQEIIFATRKYENVTARAEANVKGLTSKRAEWIFRFKGYSEELYTNHFIITSGYGESDSAKPLFLTLDVTSGRPLLKLVDVEFSGAEKLKSQKWHMTPVRADRGHVEVQIYAELLSSEWKFNKYYITIPHSEYNGVEYHVALFSPHDVHNQTLHTEIQSDNFQVSARQTFRILECDYELDSGAWIRKIRRKRPHPEDQMTLIALFHDAFGNPFWLPKSGTVQGRNGTLYYTSPDAFHVVIAGKIFKWLFGLSNARFYHMRKQFEQRTGRLPYRIAEAMSESTSIFDYAGKMRIKPKQFQKMYKTWKQFSVSTASKIFCVLFPSGQHPCVLGRAGFFDFIITKRDRQKFLRS